MTVFVGAFLLFLIQPAVGKIVTPQYGGVAQAWCVCLLFFQIALLVGYGLSYGLSRLPLRAQGATYLILMTLTALTIQIPTGEAWSPADWNQPIPSLLGKLALTLAAPCALLATVSATMQNWFARLNLGNPYPLYALSNIGSMSALIAYPTLLEQTQTLGQTIRLFEVGYWLLAALAITIAMVLIIWGKSACAVDGNNTGASDVSQTAANKPLTFKAIAWWLLLSAFGVILFMSFTSHATHTIAPVPLLWIAPLGLYLLSFIVCFGWPGLYRRRVWMILAQAFFIAFIVSSLEVGITLMLGAAALFSLCMVCHGELYARRPEAHQLTLFYLMLSIGGAIGGCLVSLGAPLLLPGDQEFFLIVLAMAFLMLYLTCASDRQHTVVKWLSTIASAVTVIFMVILLGWSSQHKGQEVVRAERNFYGSVHVALGPGRRYLDLGNGRILHGRQMIDPTSRRFLMTPTLYYAPDTAVGLSESFLRERRQAEPLKIGVIGLGTGTIAAYGRKGDAITFYEIDPKIRDIAQRQFGFLKNSQARVTVLMGDGRLTLKKQVPQQYDLLVVDAFSGDSIPIHLLTREAIQVYRRHLKPDGLLLMHITNQYLDLIPVLNNLAGDQGLDYLTITTLNEDKWARFSMYGVFSPQPWAIQRFNDPAFRRQYPNLRFLARQRFEQLGVWTDDFSNPLAIVRF
ncbi:MAG: fused MFS/spermidine synthase [Vampirovibrionales bacterium]|nr:fused MFS/spermidine synthase [Vampirovibrionales bacterium]